VPVYVAVGDSAMIEWTVYSSARTACRSRPCWAAALRCQPWLNRPDRPVTHMGQTTRLRVRHRPRHPHRRRPRRPEATRHHRPV